MFESEGATASAPTLAMRIESVMLSKVAPPLEVFQTPPVRAPAYITRSRSFAGSAGMAIVETQAPARNGPRLRNGNALRRSGIAGSAAKAEALNRTMAANFNCMPTIVRKLEVTRKLCGEAG